MVHPDDRAYVKKAYANSLETRLPYSIEHRLLLRDGTVRHVYESCETSFDTDGKPLHSVGTVQDITERKHAEIALAHQLTHDNLTGLLNRLELDRRLARVLETTGTSQSENAFCYLDLDQFKVVNDTCGHAAGDELLRNSRSFCWGGCESATRWRVSAGTRSAS